LRLICLLAIATLLVVACQTAPRQYPTETLTVNATGSVTTFFEYVNVVEFTISGTLTFQDVSVDAFYNLSDPVAPILFNRESVPQRDLAPWHDSPLYRDDFPALPTNSGGFAPDYSASNVYTSNWSVGYERTQITFSINPAYKDFLGQFEITIRQLPKDNPR
jgi:hypothetical protein